MNTRRHTNTSDNGLTDNRRVKQSKTSENSLPIPLDLIIEIFSRLPLKSIASCRCVSKFWASFLRRQDFTELFLSRSSTGLQILFAARKDDELFFFSLPQPQIPNVNLLLRARGDPLKHLKFDRCDHIRGLVNGFICLEPQPVSKGKGKTETVPVICNLTTGQVLSLPKLMSTRIGSRSLLGYDPVEKQFKVLSMTSSGGIGMSKEHQVLTLGNRKMSWRMIECCTPCDSYPHSEICINGVLYYPSVSTSRDAYLIVCFEVRSEKFSFVKVKEPAHRRAVLDGTLVNYNGKLGLILCEGSVTATCTRTSFNLWVLEDIEKQEWCEHIHLFPALWKNMVGICMLRFEGVTPKNEIVLSTLRPTYPFYIFYFNPETNTIARVEIQGMDASVYHNIRTFVNHVDNVKLM